MARPFRKLLRRIGLDYVKAPIAHWQRIAAMLDDAGVTVLLDVGANEGQYVGYLRAAGWSGRVVSFEPVAAAHAKLTANAARDADWQVAPAMALGAADGQAEITVSKETDMSSLLPLRDEILRVSPSSAAAGTEIVAVRTLDRVFADYIGADDRAFLKIDTQGYERAVLDGAAATLPRLAGLQVELSLTPLYQGEGDWRALVDRIEAAGFALSFVLPGYYDRHLKRMLQFDGVFMRRGKLDKPR
ncbi:MAG TPA: FkbM family methyltransferase [Alphaproteobacteria bacterium]|nr:FkbM family methyltransferase [Alphaproteobacteria bacterium]